MWIGWFGVDKFEELVMFNWRWLCWFVLVIIFCIIGLVIVTIEFIIEEIDVVFVIIEIGLFVMKNGDI